MAGRFRAKRKLFLGLGLGSGCSNIIIMDREQRCFNIPGFNVTACWKDKIQCSFRFMTYLVVISAQRSSKNALRSMFTLEEASTQEVSYFDIRALIMNISRLGLCD